MPAATKRLAAPDALERWRRDARKLRSDLTDLLNRTDAMLSPAAGLPGTVSVSLTREQWAHLLDAAMADVSEYETHNDPRAETKSVMAAVESQLAARKE